MQAPRKRTGASETISPPAPLMADQGRCNSTALRKATRRVSQLYDAALAPCGLRSTQRSILIHIARAGRPTMGGLATALVIDRSALAHNLKPLERDGLVAIEVAEDDRRSRIIRLTRKGEAKLQESMSLWQSAQDRFERAFGVENAAALRLTLEAIASGRFGEDYESPGPHARA